MSTATASSAAHHTPHNSIPDLQAPPLDQRICEAVADPERIRTRLIDRVAYASDASHYHQTPQAVIIAHSAQEVGQILRAARESHTPVTLRSGGTSLAGQGSTEGLLIDVRKNFRAIKVLDGGTRVWTQSGATVRQVNAQLAPYRSKIGPDPASEGAATIGGVINNNSSGMACGTEFNTYRTLESMEFVLSSGTVINSADADAETRLRALEPELVESLIGLQRRVRSTPESVRIIKRQFAMKNTMGYGLNAFLDFDNVLDLLVHLIISSEGTLAFVSEAIFRTVPISRLATTTLAVFPTLEIGARVLPALVDTGAATLELMDATSIRVGQTLPDTPAAINGFEVDQQAALLIEYHADEEEELTQLTRLGTEVLGGVELHSPATFSPDAANRNSAWNFRKGLYASVAGARRPGTTALLEDIVVPVPDLAAASQSLQQLFKKHGYEDGVIFGHAKDGNLHYVIGDRFDTEESLLRYETFIDGMAEMVWGFHGNLKAEHGTGRAMAPYVRGQYNDELYEVMLELKAAIDPGLMLNPGVILDETPGAHIRNMKVTETIEAEAERCVECGFCEPVCPSRQLTLTPRQRIVVRRAEAKARARGDQAFIEELEKDYDYDGIQTCAVDGMCQTACPVQINTGDLVKRLRQENRGRIEDLGWDLAARAWGPATRIGATALHVAQKLPTPMVRGASEIARGVMGTETVPRYEAGLPAGGSARRGHEGFFGAAPGPDTTVAGVYLPACVNSMFGPEEGEVGVTEAFRKLLVEAGVTLLVPGGVESICCGTPWSSKGMATGHETMAARVRHFIRHATREGELPVISDAASCTEGFAKILAEEEVAVLDAVSFTAHHLLGALEVTDPLPELVLHPTCSSKHLGLDGDLQLVAQAAAAQVHTPIAWGCCGFAGDRGMLHPELTAAATAPEAAEVAELGAGAHASCNRTCEIGMSRATGQPYTHVLEALAKAVAPGGLTSPR
ncbi:putative FAD-linked oxidoreductase [Corynebacterium occultum]|uniref:D-lactate dehydrogenase (cytochrome) n=1 Tax=Corynebacterium occultum TaxID=2675219 RepID=A0A6B8VR50_9CORY|nr:FAD-binding and (Fe-S)-binding domain-containing protein [Corynebacterium occultum]QGU08032.1 putative FAD-linked oxidoreductase [Corynebacterium occultum]